VGSKSSNLPAIADKVPGGPRGRRTKPDSRVKRFERWLRNEAVESETFFLPFAKALLLSLSHVPLVLVIDGSVVGRGCMTLMISLVYKQRGLPIVWTVAKRRKGHFPERIHIELMNKLQELIPEGARVVLLGDGEFDGVDLQCPFGKRARRDFFHPGGGGFLTRAQAGADLRQAVSAEAGLWFVVFADAAERCPMR